MRRFRKLIATPSPNSALMKPSQFQEQAVTRLAAMRDQLSQDLLVDTLDVEPVLVAKLLADRGAKHAAIPRLITLLQSDATENRVPLIEALGYVTDDLHCQFLANMILRPFNVDGAETAQSERVTKEQEAAARALARNPNQAAFEVLVKACCDSRVDVAAVAVHALGSSRHPDVLTLLSEAVESPQRALRAAAVEALECQESPHLASLLVAALRDWSVGPSAARALKKLKLDATATGDDSVFLTIAERNWGSAVLSRPETRAVLLREILGTERPRTFFERILVRTGNATPPSGASKSRAHRIENALFALIEMSDESAVPHLISGLDCTEDKYVAEAFLNCGHEKLAKAAASWAKRRGYEINRSGGIRPVVWRDKEKEI
ncbi:MAG: HEAT repeat domain-containing protein [Nitrospira sp.]|nr:HEAT repeat domain-containing protein [Nitrospira sp.]